MKRCAIITVALSVMLSGSSARSAEVSKDERPWVGGYPVSMFRRLRTARTVSPRHLLLSLKTEWTDAERVRGDAGYRPLQSGESFQRWLTVLTAKYGLTRNHQLAVGIPYMGIDMASPSARIDSDGLGDVFAFAKWRCVDETRSLPAIALDAWYYVGTGNAAMKRASGKDWVKASAEVSKAWKRVNLHLMPGYNWCPADGDETWDMNVGAMSKLGRKVIGGVEYNYLNKGTKGDSHDIVPGVIWKFAKGASAKVGVIFNADSSMTYKDSVSAVSKLSYCF